MARTLTASVTLAATLLLALPAPALRAQAVPTTLSYQGVLTDPSGTPVPDGSYTVTLRLFTAASGGTATYAETHTVTTVGGVFAAELGAGTPVTGTWAGTAFDKGYWLETVVGAATLAPRTKLLAGPYARALTLPYTASAGSAGFLLNLTNTSGSTLQGASSSFTGVSGTTDGTGTSGNGVYGRATATTGTAYGGHFESASVEGTALFGENSATTGFTTGIHGRTRSGNGTAVLGQASGASGPAAGVVGLAESTSGVGIQGLVTAATGTTYGGHFESQSTGGVGVYGLASAGTGLTSGVFGQASSTQGRGVLGIAAGTSGWGVYGWATASSGTTYGVYGQSDSPSGRGVFGLGAYGVYGQSSTTSGRGVYGYATAASGTTYGGYFEAASSTGRAVFGWATGTTGVNSGGYFRSASPTGRGVYAEAVATTGLNYGIYADTDSPSGYAGWFNGNTHVAGTLSKSGGSFEIDHPLDPENRVLRHSFVESPDMMNVYNGNVTLDRNGEAVVTLPDWFEALNRDFRYQLTCIGGYAPVYVAEEVRGNRFRIGGGTPGLRVSWQVTGIRHDAWAEQNRIVVEEDKPAGQRGRYLNPEAFGQPETRGVAYDATIEAEQARLDEERARQAEGRSGTRGE